MKGLLSSLLKFKLKSKRKSRSSKVRNPVDIVRCFGEHLISLRNEVDVAHGHKYHEKIEELGILIAELKCILYGTNESEPNPEACALVTQEFFQGNMLRLLILCLPELDLEELLTRHKSTVAEFLSVNYDWFFREFNSKLLESPVYITRRQAIKLLGDILLDRSNAAIMVRYVSSIDNLKILMNLLRDQSKSIQLEAFHIFKLFTANRNKPSDILSILIANRNKLLCFVGNFKIDKEDDQFEADKAQVIKDIAELEPGEIQSLA